MATIINTFPSLTLGTDNMLTSLTGAQGIGPTSASLYPTGIGSGITTASLPPNFIPQLTTGIASTQLTTGIASTGTWPQMAPLQGQTAAVTRAREYLDRNIQEMFGINPNLLNTGMNPNLLNTGMNPDMFMGQPIPNQLFGMGRGRVPARHTAKSYKVLFIRTDVKTSTHRQKLKTNIYTDYFRSNVIQDFDILHEKFPFNQRYTVSRHIRITDDLEPIEPLEQRTKTFSFVNRQEAQALHIAGEPALVFISIIIGNHPLGVVREVHLYKILHSSNPGIEKLKRLFLRHMGFNCTKQKNRLVITYRPGEQLIVDPKKDTTLSVQARNPFDTETPITNKATLIGSVLYKTAG